MTGSPEAAYTAAICEYKEDFLPVLQELLRLQAGENVYANVLE